MANDQTFYEKCYRLLKQVPAGRVTTYKEMARALESRACRAVDSAISNNRQPIYVPCHRVLCNSAKASKYVLGSETKSRLLNNAGIEVVNGSVINLDQYLLKLDSAKA